MSTQSGISASKELIDAFRSLEHDFLVIKISDDSSQLVPDQLAPKTTHGELNSVFPELNSYVAKIHPQPVYIVLSLNRDEYAFISFIPDVAHIRDKMLYASTKNTLLQELGSSNIKKDYLFAWSELDELTLDHFEHSTKADDKIGSTDEALIEQISALEVDSAPGSAYSRKLASMDNGNQFLFKIDPKLESELSSLGDKGELIIFNIDLDTEEVKLLKKDSDVAVENLVPKLESLDVSGPKFVIYNYLPSKYAFIYTCPSGSKVKSRMVYASNKAGLVTHLRSVLPDTYTLEKVLEIGDPEELEFSELKEATHEDSGPKVGLKFNKPKGPRRR